jgi:hypothetical protein
MLRWLCARLLENARDSDAPQINDQLAFLPDDPDAVAEVTIRVATPYRLADGVLFQRTTDLRVIKRQWPSGLDLAAALGSPFARQQLEKSDGKELLAIIDRNAKPLFQMQERDKYASELYKPSLYKEYLACLGTLLTTKEPDWPAFMNGEAWQAKTCQTALASWAQMRHTWVLQSKLQVEYESASREHPGFIEPVPEFYGQFERLCTGSYAQLARAGAFEGEMQAWNQRRDRYADREIQGMVVPELEEFLQEVDTAGVARRGVEAFRALPEKTRSAAQNLSNHLRLSDPATLDRPEQFAAWLEAMRKEVDRFAREGADIVPLAWRWESLRQICSRLELLSHKQLRGRQFSDDEATFLRGYGKNLAGILLYDGNSYIKPRDDAPRVVDIFGNGGKFLEVGIARPRAIYVLYPWKGKEILCRGAVLPYREFIHGERLTDEAWRTLLNTPDAPAPPAWIGK